VKKYEEMIYKVFQDRNLIIHGLECRDKMKSDSNKDLSNSYKGNPIFSDVKRVFRQNSTARDLGDIL
jgi:hypothetical protein